MSLLNMPEGERQVREGRWVVETGRGVLDTWCSSSGLFQSVMWGVSSSGKRGERSTKREGEKKRWECQVSSRERLTSKKWGGGVGEDDERVDRVDGMQNPGLSPTLWDMQLSFFINVCQAVLYVCPLLAGRWLLAAGCDWRRHMATYPKLQNEKRARIEHGE